MLKQYRSALFNQGGVPSGGLGGGLAVVQFFNPETSSAKAFNNGPEGPPTNGNWIFGCGASRGSGITATNGGFNSVNETNAQVVYGAETRYDTGGVSDGSTENAYVICSTVGSYVSNSNDGVYNNFHAGIAFEMSGLTAISSALVTGAQQGVDSDPNVTIPASGVTYDALLVTIGCGCDALPASESDQTSNYTPSVSMVGYSAHHAYFSNYRSDAFIGVMGPMEGAFTVAMAAKGFGASGWLMRVYGLTGA